MIEIKEKQIEKIERKGFGYKPDIDYGLDLEEKNFEEQIKRNKPIIKEILETWDKSTNNDVLLYFELLRTKFPNIQVTSSNENVIFKFPKKDVPYFPSPETITRIRRILNKKGIGLPTNPDVFKRRMRRQKALRNYFKENK